MFAEFFDAFILGIFGNYVVFGLLLLMILSIIMLLLNIPANFIVIAGGIMIIVFNAIWGGTIFQILAGLIALILGIKIATGIYSLFRHGI
jgi:hypothetical protein